MSRHTLLGLAVAVLAVALARPAVAEQSPAGHVPPACVLNLSPATGKLPVRTPTLAVYSFNGRVWVAPTPTPTPTRTRDPMAVRITNVDAGTKLTLQRQGRSVPLAELDAGRRYTCAELQSLAKKALVWKDPMALTPSVDNPNEVSVRIEKDPGKVWWPEARVKLSGTTRDGQELPEVVGIVNGLPDQTENRFNFQTMQMQGWRISGRYLPSARAWLQAENLLISEPTQDTVSIKQGERMIRNAGRYERAAAHMTEWVTSMQQAINRGDFRADPAKQQKIQTAIQKVQQHLAYGPKSAASRQPLTSLAAQLKQQGEALVKAGQVVRSVMYSVGAMPVTSSLSLANQRLIVDGNAALRSVSVTSDASGFAKTEVAGVTDDKVHATLSFPRNGAGSKVGSTLEMDFTIPDASKRPAVVIDGVKFYKVQPSAAVIHNDPAEQQ